MSQRQLPEDRLDTVLDIAGDLTDALEPAERYRRILQSARAVVPFDAACLMRLEGADLIPVATQGLAPKTLDLRFNRLEHVRLDIILRAQKPVRFQPDTPLPDPFDTLLEGADEGGSLIHACIGCAVTEAGVVVGALTFDSLDADAFAGVSERDLSVYAALAGAAMRIESLFEALKRQHTHSRTVAEKLRQSIHESASEAMIGTSKAMRDVLNDIDVVAPSSLPVLITGETGVGKELVARRLHLGSDRANEALIHVNCAALPISIAESELFGHVKGAFTGAHSDRLGKFEIADGGTIFLDEIGELPLELQANLLRILQNGEVQKVGSEQLVEVDVRVIAATNRNLQAEVETGRFRADLYHRLAGYPIHVPALRERRDDIPLLVDHFIAQVRRRLGLGPTRISEEALKRMIMEPWMGNIRELDNVINRGVLRSSKRSGNAESIVIGTSDLDLSVEGRSYAAPAAVNSFGPSTRDVGFRERCDICKRDQIQESLQKNNGNWAAVARGMGMHRSNLHRLASRLGMKSEED